MTASATDAIHRVMHEIKRRRLQVLQVVDLTPRMRRITVGGPELEGFLSQGSDDHIKLLFATNAQEQAALEGMRLGGPAPEGAKPAMRDYTPRRIDREAGELDIDFVLHGDGPASTWAEQAAPGQDLWVAGPRSSMIVPDVFDSYLLIGDETAIPAIARRLEELPAGRQVQVVIEIEDAQEQQPLQSAAHVQVIWVPRHEKSLLDVVSSLSRLEGELYAWIATEAALSRKLRRVLLDGMGLQESQVKAAGYWRLDENDEAVGAGLARDER
ncbi:siderophore-interacting protein [Pseudomonas sp. R5(2019)]|uniref:siderophore-interacting protein n=1 Tax=Pseudomonas sp. R5(2019) TaxID=2697566 RepID=UPI001412C7E4|nr:siderophore-interacting protein [Pseudomonas sp. R5(2019)]NBA94547.1 SIP domain-containing protein [Pseudomonas sp. R5(2019)]